MNKKWTSAVAVVLPSLLAIPAYAADTHSQVSSAATLSEQDIAELKQKLIQLNQQIKLQQQTINQMAQQVLKQEALIRQSTTPTSSQQTAPPQVAPNHCGTGQR